MKKIRSFILVCLVVTMVFSFVGQSFVSAANATQTSTASQNRKNVSITALVRLKNYIAGINTDIGNFDYNGDKVVNGKDLIVVIKILLGVSVDSDIIPDLDDDGFYNQVVKP